MRMRSKSKQQDHVRNMSVTISIVVLNDKPRHTWHRLAHNSLVASKRHTTRVQEEDIFGEGRLLEVQDIKPSWTLGAAEGFGRGSRKGALHHKDLSWDLRMPLNSVETSSVFAGVQVYQVLCHGWLHGRSHVHAAVHWVSDGRTTSSSISPFSVCSLSRSWLPCWLRHFQGS